jgi:transcription elongation factor Elf1
MGRAKLNNIPILNNYLMKNITVSSMTKPLRACPVCNHCGTKKFTVISNKNGILILECKNCSDRIEILN